MKPLSIGKPNIKQTRKKKSLRAIEQGFSDIAAGRTRPFEDFDRDFRENTAAPSVMSYQIAPTAQALADVDRFLTGFPPAAKTVPLAGISHFGTQRSVSNNSHVHVPLLPNRADFQKKFVQYYFSIIVRNSHKFHASSGFLTSMSG